RTPRHPEPSTNAPCTRATFLTSWSGGIPVSPSAFAGLSSAALLPVTIKPPNGIGRRVVAASIVWRHLPLGWVFGLSTWTTWWWCPGDPRCLRFTTPDREHRAVAPAGWGGGRLRWPRSPDDPAAGGRRAAGWARPCARERQCAMA